MPTIDYTTIIITVITLLSGVIGWLFVGRRKLTAELNSKVDDRLVLLIEQLDERIQSLENQDAMKTEQIFQLMESVGEKDEQLSFQTEQLTELQSNIKNLQQRLKYHEELVNKWGVLLVKNEIITQAEFDQSIEGTK